MKKKILAVFISAVTVIACVFGLAGCSSPKTFEKAGMHITLTSKFYEKEIVSQTAYYESTDQICTALKEDFSAFPDGTADTLEEYTDLVLYANKLTSVEKQTREGQYSYYYFTYEKTVSGKDFYYLATTHRGTDAYWLIQFACTVENKDKLTETFFGYADTVSFSTGENN